MKKRIITGTVAALAVAVILLTAGYIGFVHERYVPYEDSGLVINEDTLTATKDYNGYYSIFRLTEKRRSYIFRTPCSAVIINWTLRWR